jgi:hypothetical protein
MNLSELKRGKTGPIFSRPAKRPASLGITTIKTKGARQIVLDEIYNRPRWMDAARRIYV